MLHGIWVVPLCPLLGAALNCFFARQYNKTVAGQIAIAAILGSFIAAIAMTIAFLSGAAPHQQITLLPWIVAGGYSAHISFLIDGLSCTMMLVVTGVGLLIHIYSTGYMHDEPDYARYFVYLNLFIGAMLILVLADNYLLMFVGWEGVGLCSYLLIGFWYTRQSAADAGKKAFIVNRIGDFGFLLAMLLLFVTFNTTDMLRIEAALAHHPAVSAGTLTAIALLMFVGAAGKSAQVPLYVWLPDAMEGPTPVSALIHAATMVTAGVYMIARSAVLFTLAPWAAGVVALVGIFTALYAATMALTAMDIKRVLAYSTVSQLGYMIFAVGIGAYAAGIFHLVTHAFFKALLFLGAGSVIHALDGEQDMRKMGGLRSVLPTTHWTMLVATLAIAGIFPLAGFWSKDEILAAAIKSGGLNVLWWLVGAVTAFLTAFYMFRLYYLTFHGVSRVEPEVADHAHESPPAMRVPLIVLAVLAILGGFLGLPPEGGVLHRFLAPVFHAAAELSGHHHAFSFVDIILMLISLALALAGWRLAYSAYVQKPQLPAQWAERWQTLYTWSVHKYYVDAGYDQAVVRPMHRLAVGLWQIFDVKVIDLIVNGVARAVALVGDVMQPVQTGYVRTYALWVAIGALCILWFIV